MQALCQEVNQPKDSQSVCHYQQNKYSTIHFKALYPTEAKILDFSKGRILLRFHSDAILVKHRFSYVQAHH